MPIDEVYKACGHEEARLVDLQLEGSFSPALVVRCGGHALTAEVTLAQNVWTVFRIRLIDPCFHTREGVRIGSTFESLKRAYPDAILSAGEGQEYAEAPGKGVSFQLSSPAGVYPKASDRVIEILVVSK
jgi:hypothetical protein